MGWLDKLRSKESDAEPETALASEPSVGADAAAATGPVGDREAVIAELCAVITSAMDEDNRPPSIDRDKHLYDFGYLDSMRGADFLVHIEKRYGIFIPESELVGPLSTLDALADHIVERAS